MPHPPTQKAIPWRLALRACAALCLLIAALWLPPAPAAAQDAPVDVATYESWLREAVAAAQRNDRLGLEDVARRLTAAEEVRTADGSRIAVDNGWLSAAMDTPDPDFAQIETRLGALLDAMVQPASSAPDDARQQLADILSRPPFVEPEPLGDTFFTRVLDWLFDWLDALFGPAFDTGTTTGNVLGWLLVALCVVLVGGVLLYLLLNLRRTMAQEARTSEQHDPEAQLTANSALQQASTLARGGDYRTAVRYLYLSSLLWLDERGMLRYDRALTNREYLDRLADNPELHARLQPIVDTFDRVWYGHVLLDTEDFRQYQQQVEALRKS
jgi:hypothetical protein